MAIGCYGDCAEDRYFSKQLDSYLDDCHDFESCEKCEQCLDDCECEYTKNQL